MTVTIYHNPRCSKSRKTLEIIIESGIDHRVIKYLEEMPDAESLLSMSKALGCPVKDLLRRGENTFKAATDLPDLDDDERLAEWIAANPVVLERPIVVDQQSGRAVIGRPPENVAVLLR